MAKGPVLNVKLRLRFSAQTGAKTVSKQKLDDFAHLVIEDVMFKAVDDEAERYQKLALQIRDVIRVELDNMVRRMVRHIVGVAGEQTSLNDSLDVLNKGGTGGAFAREATKSTRFSFTYPWVDRREKYLKQKQKTKGHRRWYDFDGTLQKYLGSSSHLLADLGNIEVSFEKVNKAVDGSGITRLAGGQSGGGRFAPKLSNNSRFTSLPGSQNSTGPNLSILAGRLKVTVFGNLTPAMIPGLLSGQPSDVKYGYDSGLYGLLPREVALRLNPARRSPSPRRMTIEPYLSWFLSRAVPYAVLRRVGQLRR